MHEIGGDGVSPGHVSPLVGEGIVLEEEVVLAVEEDGAVGVVDPVGRGVEVYFGLPGGGGGLLRNGGSGKEQGEQKKCGALEDEDGTAIACRLRRHS